MSTYVIFFELRIDNGADKVIVVFVFFGEKKMGIS